MPNPFLVTTWAKCRKALPGALVAIGVSLLFWASPLGDGLKNLSYDLLFWFKPSVPIEDVVVVYMDENSYQRLGQQPGGWDRTLHAQILDRFTQDAAKLVVFDVWLIDPGTPKANEALARAIKANGHVVLAGITDSQISPGLLQGTARPPRKEFLDAAAGWGTADVGEPLAATVRRHAPNSPLSKSLPWTAAELAGAKATQSPMAQQQERWLNYYGPRGSFPSVSYCDVLSQAPGYFSNKFVFVGSLPKALYAFGEVEGFRTPYTRWGAELSPGVDLMATTFLNLYRGDWLSRLAPGAEILVLLLTSILFGGGLAFFRPLIASTVAISGMVGLVLLALLLFLGWHLWFSWLILLAIPLPSAWAFAMLSHYGAFRFGKQKSLLPAGSSSLLETLDSEIPHIPDFTLLRAIGSGSYGEVWLAKNALGNYHAVKIVRRNKFKNEKPFEREFDGLKKFTPISREHPSFVHILHVGLNPKLGYFYYIMELADSENEDWQKDTNAYAPLTLNSILTKYRKLPLPQCVQLGLALSSALDFLHRQGLIHRDLKPPNIIYVKGRPKLADVGLVTDIAGSNSSLSSIGTLGYMAPEGAGTPAADIYSLGKVLYQACTGRLPTQYPYPRSTLLEGEADPNLLRLNEIILKACEADVQRRYPSAAMLHEELLPVQSSLS